MTFTLSYLFYAGIILPTVVTLALFVFFVICWRKQSARKAVLTKPYDPHGTMRRLGIPNRPPPPPVFIHRPGLSSPTLDDLGGEDNAAYDMSRSPSAEANAGGGGGNVHRAGPHLGPLHFHQQHNSPAAETYCCHAAAAAAQRLEFHSSPSGELDITGRLAFHSRLDSGLSEPACDSPGACSNGGGSRGEASGGVGGGGGGVGSGGVRDRPQSQASHSSHSTDSEDSGFRSSRSGPFTQTAGGSSHHNEPPVLKRSRSAGRGKGRGFYHKAATSSPESETEPSIQLTPTALWPHHHQHRPLPSTPNHPHSNPHSPHHHNPHHHHHHHQQADDTSVKNTGVDLIDIGTHIGWKYLQDLASPGHQRATRDAPAGSVAMAPRQTLTCHQSMTLAQVHPSHDLDNPDVFGFSVV